MRLSGVLEKKHLMLCKCILKIKLKTPKRVKIFNFKVIPSKQIYILRVSQLIQPSEHLMKNPDMVWC